MGNSTGGPDFVKKLFKMLEDESYNDIVSWGMHGDSFVVKEIDAFTKTILPRHFKHSNFASFVRQLNKYDFHKIRNSDDSNAPYGDQAWEFKHPKFQCDKRDQLDNIRRKAPANRKPTQPISPNENNPNSQLKDLQSQVDALTKLQGSMNNHLHTLNRNYHTVVQDLLKFQKSMIVQDQLMQNLVQYLVNQEAGNSTHARAGGRSLSGMFDDSGGPFIPSEQAQKLIDSYAEVTRTSFEQMTEISKRAQQSYNRLGGDDIIRSPSQSSTNSPITPPPESLDPQLTADCIVRSNDTTAISNFLSVQQASSTNSTTLETSQPPLQVSDTFTQTSTDLATTNMSSSDNGLTVYTVGHLTPRMSPQTTAPSTAVSRVSSGPTSGVPHVDNTLPQRGPNTMRVHRSTFVPTWSIPPKVLLVEDDAVYQNIGTKFLRIFGCTIDIAVDGIGAVNKMNLEKYDLVLMDIVMPNLDGIEATTRIRQFDPTTPIISMTANVTQQDCIKYISHGMNDILAKPFDKNRLLSVLERYCTHLKVLPSFHEVPRPLGVAERSTAQSNNLMGDINVSESWIQPQLPVVISDDRLSGSQANMINQDYFNMNLLAIDQNSIGGIRYVEEMYANDEDKQDGGRQRKRTKFEILDE